LAAIEKIGSEVFEVIEKGLPEGAAASVRVECLGVLGYEESSDRPSGGVAVNASTPDLDPVGIGVAAEVAGTPARGVDEGHSVGFPPTVVVLTNGEQYVAALGMLR
jgi:hypothetical protein